METYDDAAFERFCGDLVNEGFSPVQRTEQSRWTGPIRGSLKPLTDATRMQIVFYPGWPLRYAHVIVKGLDTEHAGDGLICLWAEDDPAQVAGKDIKALWSRLDEWAQAAQQGFPRREDRALDAYMGFEKRTDAYHVELPLKGLIGGGVDGVRRQLTATKRGQKALMVAAAGADGAAQEGETPLKGTLYLRRHIDPPRTFEDFRAALTRKQSDDLRRGLGRRSAAAIAEPSGGHDFVVLAWPRFDKDYDAVVVLFEGSGDTLTASAVSATPNDVAARKRRAGPDASLLASNSILIAGAGSVGGHVALNLASSGVGHIRLHDSDYLKTANLVRHASDDIFVGYEKTVAVAVTIKGHAPWTKVEPYGKLPYPPTELASSIEGFDLVVDCTGTAPMTAALAEICRRQGIPLITGALFHQGALARIQRQADGDTLIAARPSDPAYLSLPPESSTGRDAGFLELGCTAPVNNAPPNAVLATAADIAHAAIDYLTGRRDRCDERVLVFRAMGAPFDRTGTIDRPAPGGTA